MSRVFQLPPRVRRRFERRVFPWWVITAAGAMAPLMGVLAWAAVAWDQQKDPPSCEGIGFGCTPGPEFAGVAAAIIWWCGLAVVAISLGVTELFWKRVAIGRSVAVLIALVLGTVYFLWASVKTAL